jgi:hypothetical protein
VKSAKLCLCGRCTDLTLVVSRVLFLSQLPVYSVSPSLHLSISLRLECLYVYIYCSVLVCLSRSCFVPRIFLFMSSCLILCFPPNVTEPVEPIVLHYGPRCSQMK